MSRCDLTGRVESTLQRSSRSVPTYAAQLLTDLMNEAIPQVFAGADPWIVRAITNAVNWAGTTPHGEELFSVLFGSGAGVILVTNCVGLHWVIAKQVVAQMIVYSKDFFDKLESGASVVISTANYDELIQDRLNGSRVFVLAKSSFGGISLKEFEAAALRRSSSTLSVQCCW
ncbi:hypothetical protein M427DRAFT_405673 [Gonapodya prolifera JEL478]|uniref:Uncharacterized protein n=1 Tax=Gonapodya prolifera (strain JEL478) TaxID=1344416 RepID=A0A139AUK0_GONPJ|nr:hypothetical protein M427DRAFT_405673 [Gonapodya prolifera JEL478]|eukprot:KXS20253.1 hypothetical protein M427DRAFT_405673 [Gonapodya prolifera JEL478]